MALEAALDLDRIPWDQTKFFGRLQYFFWLTDPRTGLASDKELDDANDLLQHSRKGVVPPGTTADQVWYARQLYASAFHPDSGQKQNLFGRMSFQVPGGMIITGFMLQFYKSVPAVVFWQWVNQSFNALVNYTNRNANSPTTVNQSAVAYLSATTCALITSLRLKWRLEKTAMPLLQRYVPFVAVASANCVNIPLMRQNELIKGIKVTDPEGRHLTDSRMAAVKGISQVIFSRIVMCLPGMTLLPVLMERIEKFDWMKKVHVLHAPMQIAMVGCFLVFMTPTACALFPQQSSISVGTLKWLEPEAARKLEETCHSKGISIPTHVFFNKGL